ncbi:hypothetical protein [Elioraea sp.]|uniref:hypothetical protein n=1 Tax=Elioraea sp. TaxID=2185103 RepID=UPI003F716427
MTTTFWPERRIEVIPSRCAICGTSACKVAMVWVSRGSDLSSPPVVPWAGAVDGEARDVDEHEAGLGQRRRDEACHAADDVEADARLAAKGGEIRGEGCDIWRTVGQLRLSSTMPSASMAVAQRMSLAMSMPMLILRMAPPGAGVAASCPRGRRPTQRWIAEPSQRSRR